MFTNRREKYFCNCCSYALGVRELLIAHHWAGYPKVEKKRMNTQTGRLQLSAFMAYTEKEYDDMYIKSAFMADYN
jgi:hypothetical protein